MSKCSIAHCENSLKKVTGVPMFCFPKKSELRMKWIKAVKIDPQNIRENTKVCSLHFLDTDVFHFSTKTILKPGRVPSVNLEQALNVHIEPSDLLNNTESVTPTEQKRKLGVKRRKNVTAVVNNLRSRFLIENFRKKDNKIFYYTGIPQFKILLIIFNFVLKSESGPAVHESPAGGLKRKFCKLSPLNELFLTLMKLRKGFDNETLADMFRISVPSVSRIFSAWINLLYVKLGSFNIFPHRNVLMEKAPPRFIEKYPNVLGSISCTEFNIESPMSLKQSQCFSQYKNTNTLKSLIMINATGAIIFISALYTDSISDKKILEESEFLNLLLKKVQTNELENGDIILADKEFTVKNLLEDVGIQLNIPTFRMTGMQFHPNEVEYIKKVSHGRLHVERAICRLKAFKILSNRIPRSLLGSVNQIYTVCACLTNFRFPLKKKKINL